MRRTRSRQLIEVTSSDDDEKAMDIDEDKFEVAGVPGVIPGVPPVPAKITKLAQNGDLSRVAAFWHLLPDNQIRYRLVSDLLLDILLETDHTRVADIIYQRWVSFRRGVIGDPIPFSRVESMSFARQLDVLLSHFARPLSYEISIPTHMSGEILAYASDAACLLDAGTWVSDAIIDAFGALLERYYDDIAYIPALIWKTNFAQYLTPKNLKFAASKRYLFAPMNHGKHWTFIVFKHEDGHCHFYNSFGDDWDRSTGPAQKIFFASLVDWLKSAFPEYGGLKEPVLNPLYPTQHDSVSCAIYTMHGMRCIASATQGVQFADSTWDDKVDLLRFDIFMCLGGGYIRPLVTSIIQSATLQDPPEEDLLDENPYFRFQFCAQCGKRYNCLVCIPWNLSFCDVKCQAKYARKNHLSLL